MIAIEYQIGGRGPRRRGVVVRRTGELWWMLEGGTCVHYGDVTDERDRLALMALPVERYRPRPASGTVHSHPLRGGGLVKAKLSTCSSDKCGAPIIWARTAAKGKLIPLDPTPNPLGNVKFTGRYAAGDGAPIVETLGKPPAPSLLDPEPELFYPHHATCEDVDRFRKDKSE